MKVLLLSVVVLFLAGTEGRSFWQHDEPHSAHSNILQNSYAILREVLGNLDYSEIAKEYHIKEKMENAKDNFEKIEAVWNGYIEAIKKKCDEVLDEHFPIFKNNVLPHFKEFDDKLEEELKKCLHDFIPAGSDFVSGLRKHFFKFLDKIRKLAEHGRDQVRAEIDTLRSGIQPFAEDVKAEYEKYKEGAKDGLIEKIKQLKNELVHEYEVIAEKAKPLTDNVKTHIGAQIHDVHEKIEEVLKDLYNAIKAKLDEKNKQESA